MKLTIDTKEDSHEDLRKVIKMLQHIVGDSQELFSNQPSILPENAEQSSPISNIFGDTSSVSSTAENDSSASSSAEASESASSEVSQSTEDLFAELFSEEELKKMDIPKEEEAELKPKDKKYDIELY